MYKIIIVDDEDEVREGIKEKTDWAACGFELVGDFDNGRDALDFVDSLQPDVIITDICMPFMDGLLLAECIASQYRDIKVVIVTGYGDFEYAKKAIKLKVKDYLLKPINSAEFTSFLDKMKLELDEEHTKKEDLTAIKHQLNQSFPLLRERFLESMATSRLKKAEIERKFRNFQLSLVGPTYIALVLDVDDFQRDFFEDQETEMELLRFAAFNIVQEIFEIESNGIAFRTRGDKIAVLFSGAEDEINILSQTLAMHVKQSVEKYLKLTVSIGIGRMQREIQHVSDSFQEALTALDYRFLLGKNNIISIHDVEYGQGVDKLTYNEWEKKLLSAMRMGNCNNISQVLDDWIKDLKSSVSSVNKCYGSIQKFYVSLMNLVAETGFDEAEVFGAYPFPQITLMKTIDEVKQWLEETCHRIILFLSAKRTDITQSQMVLAETFIRENYKNEDLSLSQVCNHIYISMSYFSALFKQHTGETFVEFLTKLRLEKAKELLIVTQLKTYDIASRVGYGDPQYFSVIFKRNTGKSPKEYRALNQGNTL